MTSKVGTVLMQAFANADKKGAGWLGTFGVTKAGKQMLLQLNVKDAAMKIGSSKAPARKLAQEAFVTPSGKATTSHLAKSTLIMDWVQILAVAKAADASKSRVHRSHKRRSTGTPASKRKEGSLLITPQVGKRKKGSPRVTPPDARVTPRAKRHQTAGGSEAPTPQGYGDLPPRILPARSGHVTFLAGDPHPILVASPRGMVQRQSIPMGAHQYASAPLPCLQRC